MVGKVLRITMWTNFLNTLYLLHNIFVRFLNSQNVIAIKL